MKLHGQKIEGPNVELIVLPRGGESQIVFKAQAVLDYGDFEKLAPEPVPPTVRKPGGITFKNVEDPKFVKALEAQGTKRMAWMILKSLDATEGLEWEQVKLDDPASWDQWQPELKSCGFNDIEINRIVRGVMIANSLDEEMIDAARARFLASQLESVPAE